MNIQKIIHYSVSLRVIVIAILALLLLIPVSMVGSVINERDRNRADAISEISQKWGSEQTVSGPILSVPYTHYYINEKGVRDSATEYMHFLPDELNVDGVINPEMRSRGIFDAVVYGSEITFTGSFGRVDTEELGVKNTDIQWSDSFVSIGIPDMRGIEEGITMKWDDVEYSMQPGIPTDDVIRDGLISHSNYDAYKYDSYYEPQPIKTNGNDSSGVSVKVPVLSAYSGNNTNVFSVTLKLNGSEALHFIPIGRTTSVALSSDWSSPSFDGAFLPDERTVSDEGFTSGWEILDLNRNYPQSWVGDGHNIYASAFGLKLLVPVDSYQKSERSAKYALLIIALTFMIFFFVEIFNKKRVHPIQYLLVGLALVLYYALLISFSEIVGFDWAYLISSIATIGLIVLYSRTVMGNSKMTNIQGFILAFLYVFVYAILQLEDYALLAGSIGLFVILATIMYLSRKIDWYAVSEGEA